MANQESLFFVEIKLKSIEYSKNQEFCLEILSGLTLTYLKFYSDFINRNLNKIQNCFKKENNKLNNTEKERLNKLLSFLKSGENLINKENQTINEKEFDKYIILNQTGEANEWNQFVIYANEELDLSGIKTLNYNLQFIVAFYKNEFIRQDYFCRMLIQIWEEKSSEENLFKKLYKDENFRPKLSKNVQLIKPKNTKLSEQG